VEKTVNIDELNKWLEERLTERNAEIERKIASGELVPGPINPYTGEVSVRWCLEHSNEPFPVGAGECICAIEKHS
jgi:hypothetical protein